MTKRFTPLASDYTVRMADLQAKKAKLVRELRVLDAEEVALKAFLMPFYNKGETVVDAGNKDFLVNYSETDREYLHQEKAIAIIVKAGKKVPYFKTPVVTFKVKTQKTKGE